jgi:phosphoribosyl 1,2-cyclic phosphate phosphodiesterase
MKAMTMIRLGLLGTGNSGQVPVYNCGCAACERARLQPQFRRGPTCAVVECDGQRWLIDAGLMDLADRFEPGSIRGILQTHYHADHAQGLLHWRWGQGMRMPVLGPPDKEGFSDLFKHSGMLDFSRALAAFDSFDLGAMRVTPVPLTHSKPTFGYIFTPIGGGQCIAYLTDTVGFPDATRRFLERLDIQTLVLDCSFPPSAETPRNHNDLNSALASVDGLAVDRLVLTHVGHELDCWLMQYGDALPFHAVIGRDGAWF